MIVKILEELGCHHIKERKKYITAALPDGDNPTSINVYKDTLITLVHTREDFPSNADIITLVEYINGMYFSHAIKWICDVCGYDYYYKTEDVEIDPCVQFLKDIEPGTEIYDEDEHLRKYNEKILSEYIIKPNKWFLEDNISVTTQKEFEIGFDLSDYRITIPIRDELGNLVGVKGRTVLDHEKLKIPKYVYLYPVAKTKILYGLYKSLPYILQEKKVIVFESEKSVMQSWSYGIKNCVAIGGLDISLTQVLKLEKLGVDIVLAYDKGVSTREIKEQARKFLLSNVFALWDKDNMLRDKDSPSDNGKDVLKELLNKYVYKVR